MTSPQSKPANITLSNWREPAHLKWALSHMSFMPTLDIARGGDVSPMPMALNPELADFTFEYRGESKILLQTLLGDQVDGYMVVQDGSVVFEHYFEGFGAHQKHLWASATKSIIGTVFGVLIDQFEVDLERSPAHYLPALASSAFADISIRQLLNMVSALDFSEDYNNPPAGSVAFEYFRRLGFIPAFDLMQLDPRVSTTPRGARDYLTQFAHNPARRVGDTFEYHSPNVDVAGWLIEHISGLPLSDFIRQHLWAPLNTEHDAFMCADNAFNPIATGGFNSTLRDAARFGLLALHHGRVNERQIINPSWLADSYQLSDPDRKAWKNSVFADPDAETYMPDMEGYRSFWWICDAAKGERVAMGIYGQMIYVNRDTNTVIASFSSPNETSNVRRGSFKQLLRCNRELANALNTCKETA